MTQKKPLPRWAVTALFPLTLVYYEIVFLLSTVRSVSPDGWLYIILFSAAYSGIGYLIATLMKTRKAAFLTTLFWLILTVAPFLIEYFVYLQFNVFYDLNTCLNGAAGALRDFYGELIALLLSWEGSSRIVLFLLPCVLYAIFGYRHAVPEKLSLKPWLASAAAFLAAFLFGTSGVSNTTVLSLMTGDEYNYQSTVSTLGLITGLRLDVVEYFSPSTEESFDNIVVEVPTMPVIQPTEGDDTPDTADAAAPTEAEPVVYTPNVMDIDFSKVSNRGKLADINAYVQAQTPSMKNEFTGLFEGKNLIFITAEAFSAEVIDPELTPTLYRLATKGIQFTDYYQPASSGTTGGEYQNLFSMLPGQGGGSFKATKDHLNYWTMGSQLDRLGYYGIAYHNHTPSFYDRNQTHINLGYSEGFIADGTGMEAYLTKSYWPKSDLEMIKGSISDYIDHQPFNIYYMTYSGHCGYTEGANSFTKMHWDRVAHLDYPNIIKGYLASQLEFEDAMTYLVAELEAAGIADDTVIVISADHFPYGLDNGNWLGSNSNLSKLYGFVPSNYLERDHSRLILWSGCLEDMAPIIVDTPTSSLDILPTLSNLFGTEFDSRMMVGRDVFSDAMPLVFNTGFDWKTEYGTYISLDYTFYPADESIVIPEGYVDSVKAIVRNKVRFCKLVLETDYFRHVFGQEQ